MITNSVCEDTDVLLGLDDCFKDYLQKYRRKVLPLFTKPSGEDVVRTYYYPYRIGLTFQNYQNLKEEISSFYLVRNNRGRSGKIIVQTESQRRGQEGHGSPIHAIYHQRGSLLIESKDLKTKIERFRIADSIKSMFIHEPKGYRIREITGELEHPYDFLDKKKTA